MTTEFSADEMEDGRRLFAGDWHFVSAAGSIASLPRPQGVEVAFAGRSNVGKSSLINALTGRKALARTSDTPGRTQELIYFGRDGALTLVDMPGYGFARAPKAKVRAWTGLIHGYLRGRANLSRAYVLVDARHGLKAADEPVLAMLDAAAVSYAIVLTKADQVRPSDLAATTAAVADALAKRPAAYPDSVATSARTGAGIADLRAAIARLASEHAAR